jgi:hypothetical protein
VVESGAVRSVLLSALALQGCVTAVGAVAKPTALEFQLLGAYEELDRDLMHASSLRAPSGPAASFEKLRMEALEARALQRFNRDDLIDLKNASCLAEGLRAKVIARPCPLLSQDPAAQRRLTRVVKEENRSREVLLIWAAFELARKGGRAEPTRAEVEEIEHAYERLLRDTARPEHLIEVKQGAFKKRAELQ